MSNYDAAMSLIYQDNDTKATSINNQGAIATVDSKCVKVSGPC